LRAIWTRPWADDEAADQRAFAAACREVAPEVILEAARATVEAIENPRYLKPLSEWLSRRGWEKPPLKRKRANGAPYAYGRRNDGLPRTNGNKVDTAKVFFEIAGYVEDEDGNMVRGGLQ
jgi:hypothetical protein